MDPYTAATRSRIRPSDIASAVDAGQFIAGTSLAALERRRRLQADTEVAWLLLQHGIPPASMASWVALVRQTLGAALIRAGQRLGGHSLGDIRAEPAPAVGTFGPTA